MEKRGMTARQEKRAQERERRNEPRWAWNKGKGRRVERAQRTGSRMNGPRRWRTNRMLVYSARSSAARAATNAAAGAIVEAAP
jgi:hypothetical protein